MAVLSAGDGEAAETVRHLVSALNVPQREAVIAFLRFMLTVFDEELEEKYSQRHRRRVEEAIALYWAASQSDSSSPSGEP